MEVGRNRECGELVTRGDIGMNWNYDSWVVELVSRAICVEFNIQVSLGLDFPLKSTHQGTGRWRR